MTIGFLDFFTFVQKKIKEFIMKNPNEIFNAVLLILLLNTVIFSQSNGVITYYPDDITLNISGGLMKSMSFETGNVVLVPSIVSVQNVSKLSFINDSMISVTDDIKSDVLVNIDKIKQVTINKGVSGGKIAGGAGIGALFGFGVGALIYGVTEKNEPGPPYGPNPFEEFEGLNMISYGGIGLLAGALIGGIIGAVIPNYETFDMDKYKNDRANQLINIIRSGKSKNK